MSRPGGLGRGLSALLPEGDASSSGVLELQLGAIRPNPQQPRGSFDEGSLEELADSIAQVGVLQPILVRPAEDGHHFELVAGERRLRAAERAGLDTIPAILRRTGDENLLTEALVENIHRTDLNPLEEASAYQQLLTDFGFSHEELASRLGRSRTAISNALRLLQLAPAVQQMLADREITAGHARALLAVDDASSQENAAVRIRDDGLSVRATEELVRRLTSEAEGQTSRGRRRQQTPYEDLQQRLADALATKVTISGTRRRGRVVIDYAGTADLERLLQILERGTGEELLEEPPVH